MASNKVNIYDLTFRQLIGETTKLPAGTDLKPHPKWIEWLNGLIPKEYTLDHLREITEPGVEVKIGPAGTELRMGYTVLATIDNKYRFNMSYYGLSEYPQSIRGDCLCPKCGCNGSDVRGYIGPLGLSRDSEISECDVCFEE
jgi:hypothetical protein